MSITWNELPAQKAVINSNKPKFNRKYRISGTLDKVEAQLTALAISPPFESGVDGFTGEVIQVFRSNVSVDETGGGNWEAAVSYESTLNTVELVFNGGCTSAKIYRSLSTIRTYDLVGGGVLEGDGQFGSVPDFGGLINVADGGKVDGCEVEVCKIDFSITKKWKRSILDLGYFNTLMGMFHPFGRTPVNDDAYEIVVVGQLLSFDEGTLRFREWHEKKNSDEELEISYQFSYERSIVEDDNFTVRNGDAMKKDGQDFMWFYYAPGVSNGAIAPEAIGAIVERVYPRKDFGVLDL